MCSTKLICVNKKTLILGLGLKLHSTKGKSWKHFFFTFWSPSYQNLPLLFQNIISGWFTFTCNSCCLKYSYLTLSFCSIWCKRLILGNAFFNPFRSKRNCYVLTSVCMINREHFWQICFALCLLPIQNLILTEHWLNTFVKTLFKNLV